MQIIFTICSNNYLAYATVLYQSIKKQNANSDFYLFLCDEKQEGVDYSAVADKVVVLREIEEKFLDLAARYNIVELNTSLKPRAFEYLFNEIPDAKIIYLDPDIRVYQSLQTIFDELNDASVLLTPHILTPVPFDGKTPAENHFLNFGIYNLGFLGLKNTSTSAAFLTWWKEHTYRQCYIDVYKGIFVDQLPINHAPIFFGDVKILKWPGLNMAPWNLHERVASLKGEEIVVNGDLLLLFYHFSSFKPGSIELPQGQYDRVKLEDQPELKKMYQAYSDELLTAGNASFKNIPFSYAQLRADYMRRKKRQKLMRKMFFKK